MPKSNGRIDLPFTNGFYQSRSLPLSAQRCINWYTNVSETQVLSRENLFGTPGITLIDEGEMLEPNRGSHVMNEIPFFVNGNVLYRLSRTVNPDLTETFTIDTLGTIEGTGRVSMADNGLQLCIVVPGGKAYIFTQDPDTLVEITDPDFLVSETVVYIDGYFVFNATDSNVIFHSELRDGLNYNALDFAEAEADPDNTVALHVHRNTLYVLGKETIEPYSNVGGTEFAFAPIRGGVLNKGLRSTFGVHEFNQTFAFIGSGPNEHEAIWIFQGGGLTKVSTIPVDEMLQNATPEQLDESFVFYHSLNGAHFFGITFGAETLVFDSTATKSGGRMMWHERSSRVDSEDIQWRVSSMVNAYNRTLCGDLFDGRIGELSDEVYTEYGNVMIRTCATQPFENTGVSMNVAQIEATFDAGNGTPTNDPLIGLSWSDDGGRIFSDKLFRGSGKLGDYQRRTIWRRLGRFPKSRVLRFHYSENADPSFIKLEANVKGGV